MKFGLVGFGYWGRNLARVIENNNKIDFVCIAEVDETRQLEIKNTYVNVQIFNNYKDLINQNLDAVIIATPTSTHFEICSFFLKNGINVFCEKPLTLKSSESLELDKISKEKNLVLMVGQIFEYNSVVRSIKNYIKEGFLGDILYINTVRAGLGPIRNDVNVVYDLATHDISILNYILNDLPKKINASGACFLNSNNEDIAYINLEYSNNIRTNIQVSWIEAKKERIIKIVGSKKMLIFDDTHPYEKLKIIDKGISYLNYDGDYGSFQLSNIDGDTYIPRIEYKEPLKVEIDHFLDCIINNTLPLTGAESAFNVIKVIEKIQESIKQNRE